MDDGFDSGGMDFGGDDGGMDFGSDDGGIDLGGDDGGMDFGGDDGGMDLGGDDSGIDLGSDDGGMDLGGDDSGIDLGNDDGGTDLGIDNNSVDMSDEVGEDLNGINNETADDNIYSGDDIGMAENSNNDLVSSDSLNEESTSEQVDNRGEEFETESVEGISEETTVEPTDEIGEEFVNEQQADGGGEEPVTEAVEGISEETAVESTDETGEEFANEQQGDGTGEEPVTESTEGTGEESTNEQADGNSEEPVTEAAEDTGEEFSAEFIEANGEGSQDTPTAETDAETTGGESSDGSDEKENHWMTLEEVQQYQADNAGVFDREGQEFELRDGLDRDDFVSASVEANPEDIEGNRVLFDSSHPEPEFELRDGLERDDFVSASVDVNPEDIEGNHELFDSSHTGQEYEQANQDGTLDEGNDFNNEDENTELTNEDQEVIEETEFTNEESETPEEDAVEDVIEDENVVDDDNQEYDPDPKRGENRLPTERTGEFDGERGNSHFYPNNEAALTRMQDFGDGIDSVEYIDGNPDFSPFKDYDSPWGTIDSQVEIGHMTDQRTNPSYDYGRRSDGHDPVADLGNYAQADNELADKLREDNPDISGADIESYRIENGLTWHEYPDGKSMQLVPTEIHDSCRHSGGVSDMKERMAWGDVDACYEGVDTDTSNDYYNPMRDADNFDEEAYNQAMNEKIPRKPQKGKL